MANIVPGKLELYIVPGTPEKTVRKLKEFLGKRRIGVKDLPPGRILLSVPVGQESWWTALLKLRPDVATVEDHWERDPPPQEC